MQNYTIFLEFKKSEEPIKGNMKQGIWTVSVESIMAMYVFDVMIGLPLAWQIK